MKPCGECALCCKLLEVPGLAAPGTWCKYCAPKSKNGCCTIHSERPEFCREWHCFWRAESWPDWLRPDRCKVIFEALPGVNTILISIDLSNPDAWKYNGIPKVIEKLRRKGRPLVLKTINDSVMFIPNGLTREDVLCDMRTVLEWKGKINGRPNIHN